MPHPTSLNPPLSKAQRHTPEPLPLTEQGAQIRQTWEVPWTPFSFLLHKQRISNPSNPNFKVYPESDRWFPLLLPWPHRLSRGSSKGNIMGLFPLLPFRYITLLKSLQWFPTPLGINSEVLSTVSRSHITHTHRSDHTASHTSRTALLQSHWHFHYSPNRASQLLPQGLCTRCSLPRPLFPQLLTCLYYSLISGLCSHVTLSGKLSLTSQKQQYSITLYPLPLLCIFLPSTYHHTICYRFICLSCLLPLEQRLLMSKNFS